MSKIYVPAPSWMKRLCACGEVHYGKGFCRTCYRRHLRRLKGMKPAKPPMDAPERVAILLPATTARKVKEEAKRRGLKVSVFLREFLMSHFP